MVAVAVLAAMAGWWSGRGIESPTEAAQRAQPPDASAITVPVELRVVSTAVVVRGDVGYAEPHTLMVDADLDDGSSGAVVVTGRVPQVNDELDEGAVALEVSGRPVIMLDGPLPMYRALGPGSVGPDVRQLEQALQRLGHFGATADEVYDLVTSTAVVSLYDSLGYVPAGPPEELRQQVAEAEMRLAAAETEAMAAQRLLEQARLGPPRSQLLSAQATLEAARLAHDATTAEYEAAVAAGADEALISELEAAVAAARMQEEIAEAQLDELWSSVNLPEREEAVAAAEAARAAVAAELADLQGRLGARVPRGEVTFVPSLPRRVDRVDVALGQQITGAVMNLTAAALEVTASVSAEERRLLNVGQEAELDGEAGESFAGVVSSVLDEPGTDGVPAGRYAVRIEPVSAVPPELHGRNVRVRIPVSSTGDEVLAVPLSALVTDASGAATVRVVAEDSERDVSVVVGLSADGLAKVRPVDGTLAEGDLVVIGQRS